MRLRPSPALIDQVLSNASNALLVFLIAGSSSPSEFGRFAIGYSVLAFAVAVWRNGLGYQVSLKAGDVPGLRSESGRAVAVSVVGSTVVSALIFLMMSIGSGADLWLATGLALATPFVLTQDVLRFAAVASGRARDALGSDLVWTVFLCVAVPLRIAGKSAQSILALWMLGAVVATVLILWRLQIAPMFDGALEWVKSTWRGRAHLVMGSVVSGVSVPISSTVVAVLAGPAVTGGVAGAGILMAPTNSLVAFQTLTLLAKGATLPADERRRQFTRAGAITAAVTLCWAALIPFLPDQVGVGLLGETWNLSQQAFPLVGVQYAVGVMAQIVALLLISLGLYAASHLASWVLAISRVLLAAATSMLVASVFAITAGQTVAMIIWFLSLVWLFRRYALGR